MMIAITVLGFFILFLFAMGFLEIFDIRKAGATLCLLLVFGTAWILIGSPVMHKQFSIDIVEYLVKINDDGSMSTTKQTTKTIIHKNTNNGTNSRTVRRTIER